MGFIWLFLNYFKDVPVGRNHKKGQHPSRTIVEILEENPVSPLWSCKNSDYKGSLSLRPKQRGFVPPCTDVQDNSRNLSSTAWKAGNHFDSLLALVPELPSQLRKARPVSLPFPVRRGDSNRPPSLGLVLLWGILSLEKNHKVLTPRRAVCFSARSHERETALSHCGSSTFPNKPAHRRDMDTRSMTQARNKMFLTTNDLHRQHKAQAFSGLTNKDWRISVSSRQAQHFQKNLEVIQVTKLPIKSWRWYSLLFPLRWSHSSNLPPAILLEC